MDRDVQEAGVLGSSGRMTRHSNQNHKGFVEWGYRGALKSGVNEKKKNALRYATGKVHAQIPGLSTEWYPPRAEISGDK